MRKVEYIIAWRYLFSKKGQNAINIVSGVSAAAVGVVTAAMVCVMSVMNGFGTMVEQLFSQFDPDIRVEAVSGKAFTITDETRAQLKALPSVSLVSEIVEETALVYYDERQMPVQLRGVDTAFSQLTHIDRIITDGKFEVYDGAFDRSVLGQGLAWQLGIGAHFVQAMHVYAPKRTGKVNMLRPDQSFNHEVCFIAGTFAVQQTKYDDAMMLVSLDLARRLLEYSENEATALLIQTRDGVSMRQVKRELRSVFGDEYKILDRYEQQEDFFRILRIEKFLTGLLLAFILLIATFNIIGALSMLIIDKKADIQVLADLGADNTLIRKIFLLEGWLISALGAVIGLVVGLIVCLLQEHFGFLKLGTGTEYVMSAYPVTVEGWDIVLIAAIVLLLGALAAYIPVRRLAVEK